MYTCGICTRSHGWEPVARIMDDGRRGGRGRMEIMVERFSSYENWVK